MSKPIVIMAGWVGSRASPLSKYAAVYERAGATVLQYRFAPDSIIFINSLRSKSMQNQIVQEMARGVAREVRGPSPVLFHGFSNGGAVPYFLLLQSLYGNTSNNKSASIANDDAAARGLQHIRQHFAGVLLDSAPNPVISKAARFLTYFIPPNTSALERLVFVGFFVFSILRFHWGQLRTLFPFRDPNRLFFYQMLREQTMTLSRCIPELYISSEQDFLMRTPFSDDWMAKFVARRRAIASKQLRTPAASGLELVEGHRYATGEHVSLLRAHPEDYERRCLAFLSRCVQLHAARVQ